MAINLYDETLEDLDQGPPRPVAPAPAAPVNPFLETLEEQLKGEQTRLRIVTKGAQQQSPDEAAEALRLAPILGLPADVVRRNLPAMRVRAKLVETPFSEIQRQSPALAAFISEPVTAAVAQDDLEQLGLIEWLVTAPRRAYQRGQAQIELAQIRAANLSRALTPAEEARIATLKGEMQAGAEPAAPWFKRVITGAAQQLPILFGGMLEGAKRGVPFAVTAGTAAAVAGQLGPQVALPEEAITVPVATAGGFTAGMLTGGAQFGFTLEAGLALDEYLDFEDPITHEKLDPDVAKAAAIATGALNAGLEALGLGILLKSIPGVSTLTRSLTRQTVRNALRKATTRAALADAVKLYGATLTKETAVEVAQRTVTILSGEIGTVASGQPIPAKTPTDVVGDLLQEGVGALEAFALIALPGPLAGGAVNVQRARAAQQNTTFFQALGEGITASKTAQRLPEAAQRFLEQATKDGPVETLYAPVGAWTTYFQGQGLDPASVAAEVTGDPLAYETALRTGEDLPIPTARYAVKLAATAHNTALAQELRLAPGEMNAREAAAFLSEQEAERAAAKPTEAPAEPTAPIRTAVVEQLRAAGVEPTTAEAYAKLHEAAFGTIAERAGLDPVALFEQYGLRVTRGVTSADADAARGPGAGARARAGGSDPDLLARAGARGVRSADVTALFDQALAEAQASGYQGTADDLRAAFDQHLGDALNLLDELDAIERETAPSELFRAIARAGGLGADEIHAGELARLWESSSGFVTGRGVTKTDRVKLGRRLATGALGGVKHVLRNKGGLTLDTMAEALRQDPRFPTIEGPRQLLEAIDEALKAQPTRRELNADTLAAVGIRPGARWWERGETRLFQRTPEGGPEAALASLEADPAREGSVRVPFPSIDDERAGALFRAADLTAERPATVRLADVVATQATVDLERVRAILGGAPSEGPMRALFHQGRYYLSDGTHRAVAAWARGEQTIDVLVAPVDPPRIAPLPAEPSKLKLAGVLEQRERAFIRWGPDRQFNIVLLERADLSSFLHESAHFFLEVFADVAEMVGEVDPEGLTPEQRQTVADYGTLLTWLGISQREQIGTAQHEQFATAIEAYLLEGKAPSAELRAVFARFRAWLVGIYRSIRGLVASAGVEPRLSDDVRRVFDRLLATDEAIAAAEAEARVSPLFTTQAEAQAAGISPAMYDAYRADVEAASQRARDELSGRLLRELNREQQQWWTDARDTIRATVEAEIHAMPIYRALAAIQRGTAPDGTPLVEGVLEAEPMRMSRAAVAAIIGERNLSRLPRPYVYTRTGGVHPDTVAELFGFSSGDELVKRLAHTPNMRQAIEAETDARMTAQYGDLLLDGSLPEVAVQAVLGDHRGKVIRAEIRALRTAQRQAAPAVAAARVEATAALTAERETRADVEAELAGMKAQIRGGAARIDRAIPSDAVIEQWAAERVARTRVRDLTPEVFFAASRRASQAATAAAARNEWATAIDVKTQELLNLAAYRAATEARERAEAMRDYLQGVTKPAARARLGQAGGAYLEQVEAILARYELAPVPATLLEARQNIRAWVASLEAQGLPVDLPEDVLDESRRVNWREIPLEELVGVHDAVKQIVHLARLENWLVQRREQQELDTLALDIGQSIAEHAKGRKPLGIETGLPAGALRRGFAGASAWQRKLPSLIRQMDGGKDGGPLWSVIMRPINEAVDAESVEHDKAARAFTEAVKLFSTADRAELFREKYLAAIGAPIARAGRIMVALNWGNAGNRQRLLSGYGWTESQAQGVLETLNATDWAFVTRVWSIVGSYGPAIVAKQTRVYGIAPEMVEPTPFETRFGTMPGGYFPAKYDPHSDRKTFAHAVEEQAKAMMAGAYTAATTRRGFTKARLEQVRNRKLYLDFSVIWQHVAEVVHDLTHHEMLIDVNRLLRHPAVADAIRDHYGMPVYREMQAAIRDIAAGDLPVQHAGERFLEWLRAGTSFARMGWNLMTSTVQPLGLTVSVRRIGATWVLRGVADWLGGAVKMEHTVGSIHERSSFMRLRHQTMTREIREVQGQIAPRGSWVLSTIGKRIAGGVGAEAGQFVAEKYAAIEDTYFWFIQRAQMIADVPTWLGAYQKALADPATTRADGSLDEARAVALADQAVIDSQGTGHIKDLAHAQRGQPALKLFTQFMGYFSVVYNNGAEAVGQTRFKHPAEVARLGVDLLLLYTVPMLLEEAIRDVVRGHDDDADDEGVLLWFARNQGAYLLNTVVFARELSGALQGFPYSGPAGAGVFAEMHRLYTQVTQAEADEPFWRALNSLGGIVFHYPATQVERLARGAIALERDGAEAFAALWGRKPKP